MKCQLCSASSNKIFDASILSKYHISYYYCNTCGFLQTEDPYWLKEAYNDALNVFDTGIMARNNSLVMKTAIILFLFFNRNASYLDHAGGYGIFTRMMRDIGFDFYWEDLYAQNLLSRGFESSALKHKNYEAITTFESFEHYLYPISEIEKMLKQSNSIIFSTTILPVNVPGPNEWWYYGLAHGQHISFYSLKSLNFIAEKFKLNLYTDNNEFHILTSKKISENLINKVINNKTLSYMECLKILNLKKSNNVLAKAVALLVNYKHFDLFNYVKNNMHSKTVDDMEYLLDQSR